MENVDEESRGKGMKRVEIVYMLNLRVEDGKPGEGRRKEEECAPREETETTVHNLGGKKNKRTL